MPATKEFNPRKVSRGQVICDTFKVISRLGEGGCGAVYRCKHLKKPGTEVAVKLLDNLEDLQRFNREAKMMRNIKHPNVVTLFGKGVFEGRPFMTMEFVTGGSLRDLLDKRKKLSVEEAALIGVQVVRGLRAANTVHRDLKPENILLTKIGRRSTGEAEAKATKGGTVVKLADFGLAKNINSDSMNLTRTGQVMGTPVYMSPEQCRNTKNVTIKTDMYAIGVMLFEMVTGNPPFDHDNIYDIMTMHCTKEPKFPKRMNPEIKAICERCLQKTPSKRFPTLAALERALAKLAGVEVEAPPSTWKRKIIYFLILCGLGGAGYFFWPQIAEKIAEWTGLAF